MNTAGKRALIIPVSDRLLEVASWKWGRTGNRVTTSQLTYKVLSCLTYLPKSRYAMLLPLALPSWDLTLSFILMFSNFELIYSISCLLLAPEFHGLATAAGVLLVSVCAFVWFCALWSLHFSIHVTYSDSQRKADLIVYAFNTNVEHTYCSEP